MCKSRPRQIIAETIGDAGLGFGKAADHNGFTIQIAIEIDLLKKLADPFLARNFGVDLYAAALTEGASVMFWGSMFFAVSRVIRAPPLSVQVVLFSRTPFLPLDIFHSMIGRHIQTTGAIIAIPPSQFHGGAFFGLVL